MLCCHLPCSSMNGLTARSCVSWGVKCAAKYSIVWRILLDEPRGPWTGLILYIHTTDMVIRVGTQVDQYPDLIHVLYISSPSWRLHTTCFVWATVQNLKMVSLLSWRTKKTSTLSHMNRKPVNFWLFCLKHDYLGSVCSVFGPSYSWYIKLPCCHCTCWVDVIFSIQWSMGHVRFHTWLRLHCESNLSCSSQLLIH